MLYVTYLVKMVLSQMCYTLLQTSQICRKATIRGRSLRMLCRGGEGYKTCVTLAWQRGTKNADFSSPFKDTAETSSTPNTRLVTTFDTPTLTLYVSNFSYTLTFSPILQSPSLLRGRYSFTEQAHFDLTWNGPELKNRILNCYCQLKFRPTLGQVNFG